MSRPEFATAITALRCTDPRFPWIQPTGDETEVADTLAEVAAHHQATGAVADEHANWGRCTGCRDPWPCEAWQYGTELAVQWLGRAADRVYAHANSTKPRKEPNGNAALHSDHADPGAAVQRLPLGSGR